MDKDVNVKLVNHYSLNLYKCHDSLITTAPEVDGLIVLEMVLTWTVELAEYTDINNVSCLLPLEWDRACISA